MIILEARVLESTAKGELCSLEDRAGYAAIQCQIVGSNVLDFGQYQSKRRARRARCVTYRNFDPIVVSRSAADAVIGIVVRVHERSKACIKGLRRDRTVTPFDLDRMRFGFAGIFERTLQRNGTTLVDGLVKGNFIERVNGSLILNSNWNGGGPLATSVVGNPNGSGEWRTDRARNSIDVAQQECAL